MEPERLYCFLCIQEDLSTRWNGDNCRACGAPGLLRVWRKLGNPYMWSVARAGDYGSLRGDSGTRPGWRGPVKTQIWGNGLCAVCNNDANNQNATGGES